MSVSIGGAGVSAATDGPAVDPDFLAISEGSNHFLDRAKALADLKVQSDLAYMTLRVRQDARKALDEATAALATANADRQEASAVLESAKNEAADIVARARQEAAELVNKAQLSATDTVNAANRQKADADAYVAQQRAAVDAALKRARDMEAAAGKAQQAAAGALANHRAAQAAADKSRSDYDALSKSLLVKIGGLQKTLREEMARS